MRLTPAHPRAPGFQRDLFHLGRHVQARLAAPREHWPEDLLARLLAVTSILFSRGSGEAGVSVDDLDSDGKDD